MCVCVFVYVREPARVCVCGTYTKQQVVDVNESASKGNNGKGE